MLDRTFGSLRKTILTSPMVGLVGPQSFSGAAADNYHGAAGTWHHALVLIALAVNAIAAVIEYRAIVRNGRLIDGVLELLKSDETPNPARS